MPTKEPQVTDVEEAEISEEETLGEEGVEEQDDSTPESQQPTDAESWKEAEKRWQTDLNNMKSSLQKREEDLRKEYKEKTDRLESQLRETRMQGMDENQRKQYEAQLVTEEYQTLQTRLQDSEAKNREMALILDAQQFFIAKGVPANKLVLNQGYDALVNSGWEVISTELEGYRNGQTNKTQTTQTKTRKPAPKVVTDKSTPSTGTTWKELRARYGSEENVYSMIEQGMLDPKILPGSK